MRDARLHAHLNGSYPKVSRTKNRSYLQMTFFLRFEEKKPDDSLTNTNDHIMIEIIMY